MNVLVLNGSPKGADGVSLHYARYLEAVSPDHTFEVIHAAQESLRYEREPARLAEVATAMREADLVLWVFPLYFLLVHSGYKRFIELLYDGGYADTLAGTPTAAISTSIHFYDHTAHNYIRAVTEDLGMAYVDYYAAEMHELLERETRERFGAWFHRVEAAVTRGVAARRTAPALPVAAPSPYTPGRDTVVNTVANPAANSNGAIPTAARVTVVADMVEGNVAPMVERLVSTLGGRSAVTVVDISAIRMRPCLGCLKCGFDNHCAYEGTNDEFLDLYFGSVLTADVIVFAAAIHDRYLGYRWQRYLERTFATTHQPRLAGRQIAVLVSGALSLHHNAREILCSWGETMDAHLVDIISDERTTDAELDARIDDLGHRLTEAFETGASRPRTFRGVAGMRLFADEVNAGLRFVFQADHRYYRRHGVYRDRRWKAGRRIKATAMTLLSRIPGLREEIRKRLRSGMVAPYRKLLTRLTDRMG